MLGGRAGSVRSRSGSVFVHERLIPIHSTYIRSGIAEDDSPASYTRCYSHKDDREAGRTEPIDEENDGDDTTSNKYTKSARTRKRMSRAMRQRWKDPELRERVQVCY